MGHDLTIVSTPVSEDDAVAWRELEGLRDDGRAPDSRFSAFFDKLEERYPCPSTLANAQAEHTVWKNFPLRGTQTGQTADLSVNSLHAAEVVPFVVAHASGLDMAVFDWSTRQIYRGNGYLGVELEVEGRAALAAPRLDQVISALDALNPDGGPGFLVLSGPGANYLQTAGGKGAFTVEWRESDGRTFSHWIAGQANVPATGTVRISTNGFYVAVQSNEELQHDDVIQLTTAYLQSRARPLSFTWRPKVF